MSMPPEPLTPEERALAQSLSRLGPHGGPSPDLDAHILGAARAAVSSTPSKGGQTPSARRRWPLGMGVAASVLLAAGIAWQLRPTHEMPIASEAPVDAGHSAGMMANEPEAAADAAAAPAMEDVPASPIIATEAAPPPAPAKAVASPPAGRDAADVGPARKNAEAAARQEPAPKRSPLALIPAPAPAPPPPPAPEAPPQAFPAEADAYVSAAPAYRAADASDAVAREQEREQTQRDAIQQQEQRAFYAEQRREAAAKAEDSRTLDSIAVTGSRVSSRDRKARTREAAPVVAPPAPPAPAASVGAAQPSAARNALRRTDLQVPVDADTRLPPEEWLDRIRLRRDLGDDANALRSLQLFVQEHPFQRVPDDLRPLLGTP